MDQKLLYMLPQDREAITEKFKKHRKLFDRETLSGIYSIFDEVGEHGDEGVLRVTERFDGVKTERIVLTESFISHSLQSLSPQLRSAIEQAVRHVQEVNSVLLPKSWQLEIRPGTVVGETVRPLESVGIWIPARKGPLISTAVMLVAAAKTAGVKRITVGMPPLPNGLGDPGTAAAAKLAGADLLVIGNGVSVIAGFALGTESIPETDGIFGPGPGGIAAAMSVATMYGKKTAVGFGPTECAVFADESADPMRIAFDLINEAEHGPDSSAVLVTTSEQLAKEAEIQLRAAISNIEDERRRSYLQTVFGEKGKGAIIVTPSLEEACEWINGFAPEHLMIVCSERNTGLVLEQIRNAGEILIGESTPFSAANYAIGITAVLPTNQYAKSFSGITARDMVKYSTIGKLSKEALEQLYPIIQEMGAYEHLPAHVKAADIRFS